jgi:hypothetical protein
VASSIIYVASNVIYVASTVIYIAWRFIYVADNIIYSSTKCTKTGARISAAVLMPFCFYTPNYPNEALGLRFGFCGLLVLPLKNSSESFSSDSER